MNRGIGPISVWLTFTTLFCLGSVADARDQDLRLIVQITVDQMRGDTPLRFHSRFAKDVKGFRYLLERGIAYTNAYYDSSATLTAPGHATLFTGADIVQHGLPGNEWHNPPTGQMVYCVEDSRHTILGGSTDPHAGTSPRNVTMSTIGDELRIASDLQTRVFAVALKDRGAIIPAGRLGKAFWFSEKSGEFVSSTYYYEAYPAWLEKWNKRKLADRYRSDPWQLLSPRSDYFYGDLDDRVWEKPPVGMTRTFPHSLAHLGAADYYTALRYTPMADVLTLDFVKALVKHERIGQGEVADFLSISFSASDYIGHAFGPNSLEFEDNVLRLDRTLGELLAYLEKVIGLEHVLIILSADHGIADVPEFKKSLGYDVGRLDPHMLIEQTNAALQGRLETNARFVVAFYNPSLYLDAEAVEEHGFSTVEVESMVAEELIRIPGIAMAVTRTRLTSDEVPRDPVELMVRKAFHPVRSGNVLIAPAQGWFLDNEVHEHAAMHGSPYDYDANVPLIFVLPGTPPMWVSRRVGPQDISPTIAAIFAITPPAGSVGKVLEEVIDR